MNSPLWSFKILKNNSVNISAIKIFKIYKKTERLAIIQLHLKVFYNIVEAGAICSF